MFNAIEEDTDKEVFLMHPITGYVQTRNEWKYDLETMADDMIEDDLAGLIWVKPSRTDEEIKEFGEWVEA